ncbi:MAG: hypothetical protein ACOX2N_00025 [Peptococcia bacterium]
MVPESYAGGRYYLDNCYSRAICDRGEVEAGGLIGELGSGWLKNCYASGSVRRYGKHGWAW